MSSPRRILLLHLAGQYPLGGVGWQALHHLVALRRLGHDVHYVEDSGAPPYDPRQRSVVGDCVHAVDFLKRTMDRFDLGDRWVYHDVSAGVTYGRSREQLDRLYAEADALINLCGATRLREEHLRCPVRIYLETDPVFEQIRLVQGDRATREFLEAHTHHVTYGEGLGRPECPVPLPRFAWTTTRPPVVPDLWSTATAPGPHFTTIGTWRNAGKDIDFRGRRYRWSKHENFVRFLDLPRHTRQSFELALDPPDAATAARLRRAGWRLVDPHERSAGVEVYRDHIRGSRGEFTVAKDLVVATRSGWFSDRSVCYLAAGRPVVTQDTGFGRVVETGRGLFAFSTMEEAADAIERINADYPAHSRAARALAAEHFDAGALLRRILRDAGL